MCSDVICYFRKEGVEGVRKKGRHFVRGFFQQIYGAKKCSNVKRLLEQLVFIISKR